MGQNVAQKLMGSHLADGEMTAGSEIGLRIDQTLTQDATGTMVMLELEALGLDGVRTEASVQYVDHNLLQTDERNMADHLFLRSACQRFGLWYSRPGDELSVDGLTGALGSAAELTVSNRTKNADFTVRHRLSPRQVAMVLAGGQIALVRSQQSTMK